MAEIRRAFRSDAIYLAGGNTFYFLHHLKRSGVFERLKRYAREGGAIGGLSAGAIIQTPSIGLAGYPPWDRDANSVRLKDLRGLGLVDFEFFPHYERGNPRLDRALSQYSRKNTAGETPTTLASRSTSRSLISTVATRQQLAHAVQSICSSISSAIRRRRSSL